MVIRNSLGDADGYEELLPTSATGITYALLHNNLRPVKGAYISVQDNPINFTLDGTTPTNAAGTDDGHPLASGESITIEGTNNVRNFLCIDSSAAARVKITLYY